MSGNLYLMTCRDASWAQKVFDLRGEDRSLGNVKKEVRKALCHREELKVRVLDMLHAVRLLYGIIEQSPCVTFHVTIGMLKTKFI